MMIESAVSDDVVESEYRQTRLLTPVELEAVT